MIQMRAVLLSFFTLFILSANAQYWIGPKLGYHYSTHDYQDINYEKDYKIKDNHNFEVGVVVTYTASEKYAVHGELFFEKIGNRVKNKDEENFFVSSESSFNYLVFPILLRVSMGHNPVHWYLNGGPKISYWVGGEGVFQYGDDNSFNLDGIEKVDYKVAFTKSDAQGIDNGVYFINEANRVQYSLTVGGGFYLDLANGARAMFDFRYNWGHSNMGFNVDLESNDGRIILVGNEGNIPESGYRENYEYTHNTISLSVAYMFEYNTDFKRKGSSTSSESKATKKSTKKKRG
ncbi:MAG: PorT family protein [Cytophagales bacterium]|nr:PorT family protein [Cytophagales bacterium]